MHFSLPLQSTEGDREDRPAQREGGSGGGAAAAQGEDGEDAGGRDDADAAEAGTSRSGAASRPEAATLKCRQCPAVFSAATKEGWLFSLPILDTCISNSMYETPSS